MRGKASDYLLLVAVFAILALYPLINRFTTASVRTLSSPLDTRIPFVPISILPYLSFFVLIIWTLLSFLTGKVRLYRQMSYSIILVSIVTYSIYLSYQTRIVRPTVGEFGFIDNLVALLYSLDPPHSSFPSLHSSLSTIIALSWVRSPSRFRYLVVCWSIIIVVSTVMVKQHHLLDALGGIALGVVVLAGVVRLYSLVENRN